MSFFRILEGFANGVAQSVAIKQVQQGESSSGTGRKLKRRANQEECTPCAAMAEVDNMRRSLGYKVK